MFRDLDDRGDKGRPVDDLAEEIKRNKREIKSHFDKLRERFRTRDEAREKVKLLDAKEEGPDMSLYLRYQEQLQLNRTGHSASFKSITRTKRDNLVDGFNRIEKVPPIAFYQPNYSQVFPYESHATFRDRNLETKPPNL